MENIILKISFKLFMITLTVMAIICYVFELSYFNLLGHLIGYCTSIITFRMLVNWADTILQTKTVKYKKKTYTSLLCRMLINAIVIVVCYYLNINIIFVLLGMMLIKVSTYIYGIKGGEMY